MNFERTQIDPEALAAATTQSTATAAARTPHNITPPPHTAAGSPVDVAAVAAAAAIQSALTEHNTADVAAVSKQTAALADGLSVLVQQDQDNAANITRSAQTLPIPAIVPTDSGTVWSA